MGCNFLEIRFGDNKIDVLAFPEKKQGYEGSQAARYAR